MKIEERKQSGNTYENAENEKYYKIRQRKRK